MNKRRLKILATAMACQLAAAGVGRTTLHTRTFVRQALTAGVITQSGGAKHV
jgi:hypothetical protein